MNWEYRFESAESTRGAGEILTRLDRDGWEAVSCARWHGEVEVFLRRLRSPTLGSASLGQWDYGDRIEDVG
jgi:hypothetical protein